MRTLILAIVVILACADDRLPGGKRVDGGRENVARCHIFGGKTNIVFADGRIGEIHCRAKVLDIGSRTAGTDTLMAGNIRTVTVGFEVGLHLRQIQVALYVFVLLPVILGGSHRYTNGTAHEQKREQQAENRCEL